MNALSAPQLILSPLEGLLRAAELDALVLFEVTTEDGGCLLVAHAGIPTALAGTRVAITESDIRALAHPRAGMSRVPRAVDCSELGSLGQSVRRQGYRSAAAVGLWARGELWGCLLGCSTREEPLTAAVQALVCVAALYVAEAVENDRLPREAAAETGWTPGAPEVSASYIERRSQELRDLLDQVMKLQEAERRRIAADLHDGIIAQIQGAAYELEAGMAALPESPRKCLEALRELRQLLLETVSETRRCVHNLWPIGLRQAGLEQAVRELVDRCRGRSEMAYSVRTYVNPYQLRSDAEIGIYRIVQEALHNAVEHAEAQSVRVSIRYAPRDLRVEVQDDGAGFDPRCVAALPRAQFGLMSMRERAWGLGGELYVKSEPGRGTRVVLAVPSSEIAGSG